MRQLYFFFCTYFAFQINLICFLFWKKNSINIRRSQVTNAYALGPHCIRKCFWLFVIWFVLVFRIWVIIMLNWIFLCFIWWSKRWQMINSKQICWCISFLYGIRFNWLKSFLVFLCLIQLTLPDGCVVSCIVHFILFYSWILSAIAYRWIDAPVHYRCWI